MNSAWAIIPARGGSVGIPRKNLRPVAGVPLIARTVQAARASRLLTNTYVSTDDKDIAACAAAAGAQIVERPAELAAHDSTSEAALLHALGALGEAGNALPDLLVMLQCTSPFTHASDIDGAIETLLSSGADSLFSGYDAHYHLWKKDAQGFCQPLNHAPFTLRPMRQARQAEIVENGALYVMRTQGFLEHKTRFFGKVGCYLMPQLRSIDIDTPQDLSLAESLASLAKTSPSPS